MIRTLTATLALCLLPIAASAQTGGAAPDLDAAQSSQGPMIVERMHNGFLAAPDFKFTEIDRKTSTLVGGYAGMVFDDQFFVGGGVYVLASNRRNRELAYGGLLLQWIGRGGERLGFTAKTLLGGGYADTPSDVYILIYPPRDDFFRIRQNFVVAEPELDVRLRLASHLHLTAGAGYRFTGSVRNRGFFDAGSRTGLNGAVGSIGLQIGGGS